MTNLEFSKRKIILTTAFVCAYLVCISLCMCIPLHNGSDFFQNLYYMPLLGAIGAVIFKKLWYISPVIIFAVSFVVLVIKEDSYTGLHIAIACAAASLVGSLIALLIRFSAVGGKRERAHAAALRVIAAVLAAVLIFITLYFANAFVGNPISWLIGDIKIKNYLSAVYPDSTFEGSGYNFINNDYYFNCTQNGERLDISCYRSKIIHDRNVQTYYHEKFDERFDKAERDIGRDNIDLSADIYSYIIADGNYSPDYDKLPVKAVITLYIQKENDVPKNQRREDAADLITRLLNSVTDIGNIECDCHYIDALGTYSYTDEISKGGIVTFEEILSGLEVDKDFHMSP